MLRIWLRTTHNAVEIAVVVVLVALSGLILNESIRLGPGWGEQGPEPGFFPFALACLMSVGAFGVLLLALRSPDRRPFFEVTHEVEDLLKVGMPIAAAVVLIAWAGLYVTAGLYLAYFMFWYGKFRWYESVLGGILLPVILWITLREGFNIPMPMSLFYRSGVLPF